MKKILSLLSVFAISGTALPTTIAASPYEKQEYKLQNIESEINQQNNSENLVRNKRGNKLENNSYHKEYFKEINGFLVYHYSQEYFSDSFDLTNLFGYSDWNKFKQDFSFFEINNDVNFYRHDRKDSINKDNLLIKLDIKNMKSFNEFDYNIENKFDAHDNIYPSGSQGYPIGNTNDLAFSSIAKNYSTLFNEKLTYHATYHHGKIDYSLQKYIKNDHLMLRIIYNFWLDTSFSTTGATLKIFNKNYKFY